MAFNHYHKKINKNPAALFAGIILAISAFIFPTVTLSASLFGESFSTSAQPLVQMTIELFSKPVQFTQQEQLVSFLMVVIYFIAVFLYLFNGFGLIYNKNSRYASYLTFVFLFLGLYYIMLVQTKFGVTGFVSLFASLGAGMGIWIAPIIGVLYLVLKRWINSVVRL